MKSLYEAVGYHTDRYDLASQGRCVGGREKVMAWVESFLAGGARRKVRVYCRDARSDMVGRRWRKKQRRKVMERAS